MSRSRRKRPFRSFTTADSEKQDKRAYNRCFRHATEQALRADPTGESLPILREHNILWFWIGPHAEYDRLLGQWR